MNHNILLFAQVRISTDVNKIQCDKLFMDQKGAVNLKGPKFYFTFYIRNKNKKYIRLFIKLLVTIFSLLEFEERIDQNCFKFSFIGMGLLNINYRTKVNLFKQRIWERKLCKRFQFVAH